MRSRIVFGVLKVGKRKWQACALLPHSYKTEPRRIGEPFSAQWQAAQYAGWLEEKHTAKISKRKER